MAPVCHHPCRHLADHQPTVRGSISVQKGLHKYCAVGTYIAGWRPGMPSIEYFGRVLGVFWEGLENVSRGFRERFGRVLGRFWEGFGRVLGEFGEDFGRVLRGFWEGLGRFWEGFGRIWGRFWEGFGSILGGFWEGFGRCFGGVLERRALGRRRASERRRGSGQDVHLYRKLTSSDRKPKAPKAKA